MEFILSQDDNDAVEELNIEECVKITQEEGHDEAEYDEKHEEAEYDEECDKSYCIPKHRT